MPLTALVCRLRRRTKHLGPLDIRVQQLEAARRFRPAAAGPVQGRSIQDPRPKPDRELSDLVVQKRGAEPVDERLPYRVDQISGASQPFTLH